MKKIHSPYWQNVTVTVRKVNPEDCCDTEPKGRGGVVIREEDEQGLTANRGAEEGRAGNMAGPVNANGLLMGVVGRTEHLDVRRSSWEHQTTMMTLWMWGSSQRKCQICNQVVRKFAFDYAFDLEDHLRDEHGLTLLQYRSGYPHGTHSGTDYSHYWCVGCETKVLYTVNGIKSHIKESHRPFGWMQYFLRHVYRRSIRYY